MTMYNETALHCFKKCGREFLILIVTFSYLFPRLQLVNFVKGHEGNTLSYSEFVS